MKNNTYEASDIHTMQENDTMLEELWQQLEDVPMDPETECIEESFLDFPAGTYREDIWHWFDERYSKGVAHLMYFDGTDCTDKIALRKTSRMKLQCQVE